MNASRSAEATTILLILIVSFLVSLALVSPRSASAATSNNIVITSNSDFATCGCVIGGSGTASDPFVISGLKLYSTNSPGILVDNTAGGITDYFVLTGDTITNSSSTTTNYPGVEFVNVNGLGEITGTSNTFNGNQYGIYLLDSSNILIDGGNTNNGGTVNNNGIAGIAIVGGGHNTISNIEVDKNGIGIPENFMSGGRGIELNDTTYNTLYNVILSEDSQAGLAMFSSSYNTINGIVTHYPDFYATIVDGGQGNTLENSVFQTADYVGLWLRDSTSNNLILSNQIVANGPTGHEKNPGIVPYFTVGLYLSSGATSNRIENNYFNKGNTGGSVIVDNGAIVNAVQSPIQSNNQFNNPATGNEPASPLFPSGPVGNGNTFCGNSIVSSQGPVSNQASC